MIDVFMHALGSEDFCELKIPEMQILAKLKSSNRAIFFAIAPIKHSRFVASNPARRIEH